MFLISKRRILVAGLLLLAQSAVAPAFQSSPPPDIDIVPRRTTEVRASDSQLPEVSLRADLSLVLVPVQAATREGAPILGLKREDFRVYEDGAAQEITYFAQDDAPISIGLLFDSSASMKNKKKQSLDSAAAFFNTASSGDEFFLIEFDERPKLTVAFTPDTKELYQRISHVRPFGRTSLIDSIHLALEVMKNARNERKALVIISDGGDNRSRHTYGAVRGQILESDVQLYAMGIFGSSGEEQGNSAEEIRGPQLLEQLADLTGGRHFPVSVENLAEVSARIGTLLRNRYLVGYTPSNPTHDGRYRRVTLDLAAPANTSVRVQYRKGYYAPRQ